MPERNISQTSSSLQGAYLTKCGVYSTFGVIGLPFSSSAFVISNAARMEAAPMYICIIDVRNKQPMRNSTTTVSSAKCFPRQSLLIVVKDLFLQRYTEYTRRLPNPKNVLCTSSGGPLPSKESYRSGMNSSGSGYSSGFRCIALYDIRNSMTCLSERRTKY